MNKPLLSIIIPARPGAQERLACILSRLNLSMSLFPDHRTEVLVADGGSTDKTRELCETMAKYMPVKYLYMPIGRFICAAYPRNCLIRMAEGHIIGMIDVDHYPSETIIYGMLHPFIDDADFRVNVDGKEYKVKDNPPIINGRYGDGKPEHIINRGYVIDSSKSSYCSSMEDPKADEINRPLLNPINFEKKILGVYDFFKIPPPGVNGTLWTWAVRREHIINMNAYDEQYCRQFAYVREDDDFRERLLAQGLRFYDWQNVNFCAIHLWHMAAQRNQDVNKLNRDYFDKMCRPVSQIVRNEGHPWGMLLRDSFSVINGMIRDTLEHERWISENVQDVEPRHNWPDGLHEWASLDEYIAKLEENANEKGGNKVGSV